MNLRPVPGRLYLIDTSALARSSDLRVRDLIVGLIADHAAATCVTIDLEAGYSGRDELDVRAIAASRRSGDVTLSINETIAERARQVQIGMSLLIRPARWNLTVLTLMFIS